MTTTDQTLDSEPNTMVDAPVDPVEAQRQLIQLGERVLLRNYRQAPIVLSHGQGLDVWDVAGRRYLDFTSGISVSALGHAHPGLVRAIQEQAGKLLHASNLYYNEPNILAAAAVVERSFATRVYFCNSGGEANEAALKLCRRYAQLVSGEPERTRLVAAHGSFHGRTFATMSITGQEKYRAGFGPLVEPVRLVPYGDLAAMRAALEDRKACAVVLEPIQAEGGIVVPPEGYLAGVRALCDETGTLLVFDEVQTGVGRTGRWFGHQWDDALPDVMSLAKGLGGGVPIGAIACNDRAAKALTYVEGDVVPHASTFGGNPLACAAAVAVFNAIATEDLLERCEASGEYLAERLAGLVAAHPGKALEVRGRGLLRGLKVQGPAAPVVARCRERGMLASIAGVDVVRLAPALVCERAHVDEAIGILDGALGAG
jgi:acetylornithine aminotransferase/acetylornithine/N-succinyldiaminopimelate aminotransferase